MPLSPSRLTRVGETPYPHEEEGIAFVRDALPDSEPYRAWALFELPDPSTGRLLEVDMLVLGYGALYLLELKARGQLDRARAGGEGALRLLGSRRGRPHQDGAGDLGQFGEQAVPGDDVGVAAVVDLHAHAFEAFEVRIHAAQGVDVLRGRVGIEHDRRR